MSKYIEHHMGKYRRLHGSYRPQSHVQRVVGRYGAMHGADPDYESLAGPFADTITSLRNEIDRLNKNWPRATVYPPREAQKIVQAAGSAYDAAYTQGTTLLADPAIRGAAMIGGGSGGILGFFSGLFGGGESGSTLLEQIQYKLNELAREHTKFAAAVNAPTAEVPTGKPLAKALETGASQVVLPNLRSATIRLLMACQRAYEQFDYLVDAHPAPRLAAAIAGAVDTIEAAVNATHRFIVAVWGGIKDLPDDFKEGADMVWTVLKWGTVGALGYGVYTLVKKERTT